MYNTRVKIIMNSGYLGKSQNDDAHLWLYVTQSEP